MKYSLALVCSCVLLFAGCRTTEDILRDYDANLTAGNYAKAAEEPETLSAETGGTQLLWCLMAASAYDLDGRMEEAIRKFDEGESIMGMNDQTSVFSQAADGAFAMMLNDKVFPYDGGGQDRIFTCLYKAIDYGVLGRPSSMRTELNRAGQHQENWIWQRRKDINAANERLASDSQSYASDQSSGQSVNTDTSSSVSRAMSNATFGDTLREVFGFDILTSGNLDVLMKNPANYRNLYAEHVTGVFRWINRDGGRNHLKDAAALNPRNSFLKKDYAECDAGGPLPQDQVWVYVEDGLCPYREAWRIDLPLFLIPYAGEYVQYAGLALPRLRARSEAASNWKVNGVLMQELADVDALVKTEYDVYMRGAISREITRTIVDVGIQVALGIAAEHASDSNTRLALKLSQYAAAAYSFARRGADVRSWTALPKRVYLARIPRPSSGTLEISAYPSTSIITPVPEGNSMIFVRKTSPVATPKVKSIKL